MTSQLHSTSPKYQEDLLNEVPLLSASPFISETSLSEVSLSGEGVLSPISSPSRSRQNKRRRSSPGLSEKSHEPQSLVPDCVSCWKLLHAERLQIHYTQDFLESPIDILKKLGRKIKPFTDLQTKYNNKIKSLLQFDVVKHTLNPGSQAINRFNARTLYAELKPQFDVTIKELNTLKRLEERENCFIDDLARIHVYEFIHELSKLLKTIEEKNKVGSTVAEMFYTPVCFSFARMCHLRTEYGGKSRWLNLVGQDVTSEPDLRLFKKGMTMVDFELDVPETLVSVIGVQKDSSHVFDDPPIKRSQNLSSGSDEVGYQPQLLQNLNEAVLGQHAGELLLDIQHHGIQKTDDSEAEIFVMPGMIIDGTKIYFTLLEMTADHLQNLDKQEELDGSDKATIHYAKPLDIIFKDERNILIDSFMLLNNIDI